MKHFLFYCNCIYCADKSNQSFLLHLLLFHRYIHIYSTSTSIAIRFVQSQQYFFLPLPWHTVIALITLISIKSIHHELEVVSRRRCDIPIRWIKHNHHTLHPILNSSIVKVSTQYIIGKPTIFFLRGYDASIDPSTLLDQFSRRPPLLLFGLVYHQQH